jgi:hypothetical protein
MQGGVVSWFSIVLYNMKTQVNWEGLKLNGACQFLVCTNYVDLLGENMHTNTGKNKSFISN